MEECLRNTVLSSRSTSVRFSKMMSFSSWPAEEYNSVTVEDCPTLESAKEFIQQVMSSKNTKTIYLKVNDEHDTAVLKENRLMFKGREIIIAIESPSGYSIFWKSESAEDFCNFQILQPNMEETFMFVCELIGKEMEEKRIGEFNF